MFNELDVVVVRKLSDTPESAGGTPGVAREPVVGDEGTIVQVLSPSRYTVECLESGSPYTIWLADFDSSELAPRPDTWKFQVSETSPGAYLAKGDGPRGMHVESTKGDPDRALADCRAFAIRYPQ